MLPSDFCALQSGCRWLSMQSKGTEQVNSLKNCTGQGRLAGERTVSHPAVGKCVRKSEVRKYCRWFLLKFLLRCKSIERGTCYVSKCIKTSSSYSLIYANRGEQLTFVSLIEPTPVPANTPCTLMHLLNVCILGLFPLPSFRHRAQVVASFIVFLFRS